MFSFLIYNLNYRPRCTGLEAIATGDKQSKQACWGAGVRERSRGSKREKGEEERAQTTEGLTSICRARRGFCSLELQQGMLFRIALLSHSRYCNYIFHCLLRQTESKRDKVWKRRVLWIFLVCKGCLIGHGQIEGGKSSSYRNAYYAGYMLNMLSINIDYHF